MKNINEIRGYVEPKLDEPSIELNERVEGKINFKVPASESIYDAPAFFNPVMVLNRDLAILFCATYSKRQDLQLRVFEPLAGIGIRAFRLAKELDCIDEVVICDFDKQTSSLASLNREELGIGDIGYQFKREARSLAADLAEYQRRFHFFDLDPFGSPAPFIDYLWNTLTHRAMAAITATDMTALCGVYPDAALRKYGGYSLNNFHTHETAARLLMGLIVRSAAKFEYGVTPMFTISADHYTKIFVQTYKQRGAANDATNQLGFSYTCQNCMHIYYRKYEENQEIDCCGDLERAGPLWCGDLSDPEWCKLALNTLPTLDLESNRRITKMLREGISSQGLHGYFTMDSVCKHLGVSQPSFDAFFKAIEDRGYTIVRSWFTDQAFRTDASGKEVMATVRELVSNN